jgi:steroid 5-alpha reductase family enzyme
MTLNPLTLVLYGWIIAALLMAALWGVQRVRRNAGIVDVGWCVGLVLVAFLYALAAVGDPDRRMLVAAMVGLYAARLGGHLFQNRVQTSEDARYETLRRWWGDRAHLYFFFFFQFQALGIVVFSLPLLVLMQNPRPTFSLWELAGLLLWSVSVVGEGLADWQLVRFKSEPANRWKTCREGLWRYSRHPNYFFEWLHWCAYVPMGVGVPGGWITLMNPAIMLVFLLWVSGIPWAEAQALATRGEDYRAYQRTTSAFIPWFPGREER